MCSRNPSCACEITDLPCRNDDIETCKRPMCGNTFARKEDTHAYCSKRCREIDRIDQQNARRRGYPRLVDPDDPQVRERLRLALMTVGGLNESTREVAFLFVIAALTLRKPSEPQA